MPSNPQPVLEESIDIAATPDTVWTLVSDVRRMAEWSPQVESTRLRGGAEHVADGVEFTNLNTNGSFTYTAAGVLHPEHFFKKASIFYAVDQEAVTLYTASIVVPDEETEPPQTGDAATSIGFVMIALAISLVLPVLGG